MHRQICLRSSARTDTGRVRNNNEDSIHLWTNGDHIVLAIVADGMGGAVAGEEASRIAVETVRTHLTSAEGWHPNSGESSPIDPDDVVNRLQKAILTANNNIVERAIENPELKGMGTTVTMAFVYDTQVIIGHVGDSRAYHVESDGHYWTQVTSDHTLVQALVDAGHVSQEDADHHPMRNVLYRALGQARDIEVDVYFEKLFIGDRMVLCSDGLTLHVKPEEIAEISTIDDPSEASQRLIDLANERGGHDNISVIVIKVEEDCSETERLDSAADTSEITITAPRQNHPDAPPESTDTPDQDSPAETPSKSPAVENTWQSSHPCPEANPNPSDTLSEGRDPHTLNQ